MDWNAVPIYQDRFNIFPFVVIGRAVMTLSQHSHVPHVSPSCESFHATTPMASCLTFTTHSLLIPLLHPCISHSCNLSVIPLYFTPLVLIAESVSVLVLETISKMNRMVYNSLDQPDVSYNFAWQCEKEVINGSETQRLLQSLSWCLQLPSEMFSQYCHTFC